MPAMTLADYSEKILKPSVERLLADRNQTEEEFLAECDQALAMHRRVMHWAKTSEWKDDA